MAVAPVAPTRIWPLFVGPALLVVGVVLLSVSNALLYIGPFDRAAFGWAFCIPLLAIAPAASGLAGRWASPGSTMTAAALVAIACGAYLLMTLATTVGQIGCEPVSDPIRIAAHALPLALVAGAAYLVPALVAFRYRARPWVAIVAGIGAAAIGGTIVLLTFAALFPGVTCVPRSTFGG